MRRRLFAVILVLASVLSVDAWSAALRALSSSDSEPPPFPTQRVSPAAGAQSTRFTFVFRSYGSEAFDPGYSISLRGPAGTRCAKLAVGEGSGLAIDSGRIRVVMGPGLPRDPASEDGPTIRAAPALPEGGRTIRRWCPGRYVGRVGQGVGDQQRFSFCVRGASCASPPPRCRLPRGSIVAARGQSAIWSAGGYPHVLYGCYGRGTPTRLGGAECCGGSSTRARFGAISGRFGAVIETYQCCGGLERDTLRVFDLRARRSLGKSAPIGRGIRIESVVLTASGAAAYTVRSGGSQVAPIWQVHSLDATGEHVLDAGPHVAPGSLARDRDGNLTWRTATDLRTSRLR